MPIKEITTNRLEAFSDGVIAIILTIMVLELKVPHIDTLEAVFDQWPIFLSYVLSYIMVAEYWMNHHLLFHLIRKVDNRILWSNLLLLFAISLIPFFTAFMGENRMSAFSVATYSAYMLVCAGAFFVLFTAISAQFSDTAEGQLLRHAGIVKNLVAMALYAAAIPAAHITPVLSILMNIGVAAMYFLPNAWLERKKKG